MRRSARVLCCALATLLGPSVRAGTISFSGNLAGAPPLLTTITTPATIAVGASITEPFSASIVGIGSVSGSLLLSNLGSNPSIAIQSLTVTNAGASLGFGFTASQDFAYAGSPFLNATDTAGGTATFTAGGQIASFGVSSSLRGAPNNAFVSLAPGLSGGNFSLDSDAFPAVKPLAPGGTGSALNVPASGPVTEIFAFASTLIGAGTSITMTPGSGVIAVPVPEPSSLVMGLGAALLVIAAGIYRRLPFWK
jgi:hypothetical protein